MTTKLDRVRDALWVLLNETGIDSVISTRRCRRLVKEIMELLDEALPTWHSEKSRWPEWDDLCRIVFIMFHLWPRYSPCRVAMDRLSSDSNDLAWCYCHRIVCNMSQKRSRSVCTAGGGMRWWGWCAIVPLTFSCIVEMFNPTFSLEHHAYLLVVYFMIWWSAWR